MSAVYSSDEDDEKGSDFISLGEFKDCLVTAENPELRIVMVGKSGVGKSATANTILGRKEFKVERRADSVTGVCNHGRAVRNDRSIYLVDTPGLYSTTEENNQDHVRKELDRCIQMLSPGFHAVLFTLSATGRFTEEDKKCFEDFFRFFGETFYKYTVVIFTHAHMLEAEGISLKEYVGSNIALQSFLKKCGNRIVAINNKNESQAEIQVNKIISEIEEVQKKTKSYYTNDDFKKAEEALKLMDSKNKKIVVRQLSVIREKYEKQVKTLSLKYDEEIKRMEREVTRNCINKEQRRAPCVIQ